MITSDIFDIIEVREYYIPDMMDRRRILSITHDSRRASPTSLFICKSGARQDGHAFASSAYEKGARVFIAERKLDLPSDAAVLYVDDSNMAICSLAVAFFGDPSSSMRMIGITGTKGKTTVALSIYNIASEYGLAVGYIGTNGIYYGDTVLETVNTTPDPIELQRSLREMLDSGIDTVIIEVSSQALWQKRVYGIKFDTCVFTNLYEDHIGGVEHPTMEHYKACKRLLFTDYGAENIVINADSPVSNYMIEGVNCKNIIMTSASGRDGCDVIARRIRKSKRGIRPGISFELVTRTGDVSAFIPIPGRYSVENGLLTYSVCSLLGMDADFIVKAMSDLQIPGRFESVELEGRPKSLFVIDYAHNGASLTAVLRSLREYKPERIIVLFGSVGGRTFGRRAELGIAARDGADVLIVTSDNPDNEDPMSVINDINEAIGDTDKPVYLIPDRQKAIEKAYEIAKDGDFILLAGKGHESYQLISGKRVPFSERDILEHTDALNLVH